MATASVETHTGASGGRFRGMAGGRAFTGFHRIQNCRVLGIPGRLGSRRSTLVKSALGRNWDD